MPIIIPPRWVHHSGGSLPKSQHRGKIWFVDWWRVPAISGAQWGPDLLGEFQEVFYWELVGPFAAEAPDFRPKSMWFLMEETHGWQIIPNLFRYGFFLEDALLRRPLVVLRGLTGTAFAFESIQTEREREGWTSLFTSSPGLSVFFDCLDYLYADDADDDDEDDDDEVTTTAIITITTHLPLPKPR